MSSKIPLKAFGPAAQAFIARKLAATQREKISERVKKGKRNSALAAEQFVNICERAGLPKPELEYRFMKERKFRFDFAWPRHLTALEVDGGIFLRGGGGHNHAMHVRANNEKSNDAAELRWVILRVFPEELLKMETVERVRRTLAAFGKVQP